MDDPKVASAAELYDDDFYAWTEAQAAALREHGRGGNAIDFDRVAEEVEDLGRSELNACESLTERIIEHLLKLDHAELRTSERHWRLELAAFHRALLRRLTPSLQAKLASALGDRVRAGRRMAAAALSAQDDPGADILPELPEIEWDRIVAPD